ncbi:hypothetical protein, partial, partial [Parasitella parasitica]
AVQPNRINAVEPFSDDNDGECSSDSYYDSDSDATCDSSSSGDDLSLDDTRSVYRYPYDLSKMKWSSPLKAEISINNKRVTACFDTGGSISVISKGLCDELGLVTNGDSLQLVGFDNNSSGSRAEIVMDVPISIQGHVRPEHMCVQANAVNDLLILGVPWFQAYGVE